jgi:hypothetical protein
MKPVDDKTKNTVTAVLKYFKNNKKEIKTRAGYLSGFSTEKFSIDNTDTRYSIVFNSLTLFSSIKTTIYKLGPLVSIEEVSIIKSRAAIVPGHFFLVDPELYDYILYRIRLAAKNLKLDNEKDDTVNEIEDFEIKL